MAPVLSLHRADDIDTHRFEKITSDIPLPERISADMPTDYAQFMPVSGLSQLIQEFLVRNPSLCKPIARGALVQEAFKQW